MNESNLRSIEAKAFVPARDFELSKRFYQAIGFALVWSTAELAYFRHNGSSFLLQNFYVKEHAENFMMHLLVENVDEWWKHITAAVAPFGISVERPADRPWGMRDFPLIDPGGVLWRIGQNLDQVVAT
jgi:catechol 2,3-dioxygenase-like lactoylglutathione lyase family enzyme